MGFNTVLYVIFRSLIYFVLLCCCASEVCAKPHYATLVMAYPSRQILFSENPEILNQPASLTKVMTLYLVFQALDRGTLTLTQPLHVSAHAANRQPSKLGLKTNSTITVQEAICGLVTKSANDAATVLGEELAGGSETDFSALMTAQARKLGMVNTTFQNASGIADKKQLTTAHDMAILGASIMRDFPHYYHYFSLREFDYKQHTFKNHNHLLGKYRGCDGIKTGYTTASGFNLLSSAQRDGHRLIAVVLGGSSIKSRDQRMMEILDLGFSKIASQPQTLTSSSSESATVTPPAKNVIIPAQTPLAYSPELEEPNTTVEEEY
jgi:D-alanyl-D-alanine carboxypeptidase